MTDILNQFGSEFFYFLFDPSSNTQNHWLLRIVDFIVGDPLIMAVIAMFFTGFIVSILLRIYHTA